MFLSRPFEPVSQYLRMEAVFRIFVFDFKKADLRINLPFVILMRIEEFFMLNSIDEEQLDLIIGLLQSYFLYAVIALAVILGTIFILIRLCKPENIKKFSPLAFGIIIGFSLLIIFTIISLTLTRYTIKGRIDTNFWLLTGLVIGAVVLSAVAYVLKTINSPAFKPFVIISLGAAAVYSLILVTAIPAVAEYYEPSQTTLYYILSTALIAILALSAFLGKKTYSGGTRTITYAAACIATSFALSYLKFFELPQGGSITFASLVPIMIYSYMFGTKNGVLCCTVYGLLQFMQSPQLFQPMQFFLDYPIAFGFIGLTGLLRGRIKNVAPLEFLAGGIIAAAFRFVSHFISGIFVFYTYAGDQNPLAYSLVYNSFVFVDIAIALAVGMLLFASKSFKAQLTKTSPTNVDTKEV